MSKTDKETNSEPNVTKKWNRVEIKYDDVPDKTVGTASDDTKPNNHKREDDFRSVVKNDVKNIVGDNEKQHRNKALLISIVSVLVIIMSVAFIVVTIQHDNNSANNNVNQAAMTRVYRRKIDGLESHSSWKLNLNESSGKLIDNLTDKVPGVTKTDTFMSFSSNGHGYGIMSYNRPFNITLKEDNSASIDFSPLYPEDKRDKNSVPVYTVTAPELTYVLNDNKLSISGTDAEGELIFDKISYEEYDTMLNDYIKTVKTPS